MDPVSKPVLFLVDETAADASALAAALAVRYAGEYDIRTATTANEAQAAFAALSADGATLAMVIVTRSLPDADPVALLNRARELHPDAKRLLIARYIDPLAFKVITAAMRSGRIDYFLNKPWEPPSERLYPIVDDLLGTLRDIKRQSGFEAIRIIGPQWDPFSHKLRDILARSTIAYGFYDSESEAGRQLLASVGVDGSRLPVLIFFFGAVLVQPTTEQIVDTLGARTKPEPGLYDVAIVGAGPAGLAAAVYAASEGLRTLIIERETFGGQASTSSHIANYLGFPRGVSGKELSRRAYDQAWRFGAAVNFTKAVTALRSNGAHRTLVLSDGIEVECRTAVIATGVAYRRLEVPSLESFNASGVFYGAPMCEAPAFTGEDVLIVGAGNSAGQAAVHLAKFARRVTMVVRGKALAATMSDYLVHQLESLPNVEMRFSTRVVEGHGDRRLTAVTVETADGAREQIPAAGLFVMVGGVPHTQWLAGSVECDPQGYILTGRDMLQSGELPASWPLERHPYYLETSIPGVFAAGDVRSRSVKRVASAVGEGATAIQLVHEFLRSG